MKEVTHHVVVSQKDQFVLDVFDTERDAYANAKRAVIIYEDLREHWRHDARRKHMRVVCACRRSDRRPSRLRSGTQRKAGRDHHHDVRVRSFACVCWSNGGGEVRAPTVGCTQAKEKKRGAEGEWEGSIP